MKLSTLIFLIIGCTILSGMFLGCSGEKDVEELRALGKKAFLEQDYQKARQYFLEAITEAPSDRELLFLTGMSFKRDFLLDSAMFYLKKVDLLFPDDRERDLHRRSPA